MMKRKKAQIVLALALAGLTALAVGCTSGEPEQPASPSPATVDNTPELALDDAPKLALDKLQVDLGTLTRNQEGIQTFLVMNMGGRPLHVGPVSIQVEQGCDAAETIEGSSKVPPGEVALLPIKLGQHRELGPHLLQVVIESDDPATPRITVPVSFTVAEYDAPPGTGPHLVADKEVIDIGTVPYDWPLYEQFTLRNDGDELLVLEGTPVVRVEEGC